MTSNTSYPTEKGLMRFLPKAIQPWARRLRTRQLWCDEHGYRYWSLSKFILVPGYLLPAEAIALYSLARRAPQDARIVEIGSWLGKSSVVFGLACKGKRSARVTCIDPFDATGDERSAKTYKRKSMALENSLFQNFTANVKDAGVASYIDPIKGLSVPAAETWKDPIDIVFIDGDHTYEAVCADIRAWAPHIKPGGIMCLHDVYFEPLKTGKEHIGPGNAVRDLIQDSDRWVVVDHINSLFIARRTDSERDGSLA